MEYHEALLAKALFAVLQPDHEAFMRHVRRFYSKTFHVPLPDVEELDEEHVLTSYYEEALSQMSEEDREDLRAKVVETPEEREERERKERLAESRDDAFFENLNREVKEGKLRGPPKETKVVWKPKAKPIKVKPEPAKETPAPKPPPEPFLPDIHMSFGSNLADIPDEWASMDPLGLQPKK